TLEQVWAACPPFMHLSHMAIAGAPVAAFIFMCMVAAARSIEDAEAFTRPVPSTRPKTRNRMKRPRPLGMLRTISRARGEAIGNDTVTIGERGAIGPRPIRGRGE